MTILFNITVACDIFCAIRSTPFCPYWLIGFQCHFRCIGSDSFNQHIIAFKGIINRCPIKAVKDAYIAIRAIHHNEEVAAQAICECICTDIECPKFDFQRHRHIHLTFFRYIRHDNKQAFHSLFGVEEQHVVTFDTHTIALTVTNKIYGYINRIFAISNHATSRPISINLIGCFIHKEIYKSLIVAYCSVRIRIDPIQLPAILHSTVNQTFDHISFW